MKFKYLFVASAITLSSWSTVSFGQDNLINALKNNQSKESKDLFGFQTVINIENTDVKNQGRSGTCWSYATNSFLESEMIKAGKEPVDLSEIFTARNAYIEKGKQYVRMHGAVTLGDGGECHDVINMYRKYGAMPQSAYSGLNYGTDINDFSEMAAMQEAILKAVINTKRDKLTPNWINAYTAVIDSYLGTPAEKFMYNGKQYTPQTFAKEVVGLNADDYIELSSFTEYPLYEKFVLPVPDNWSFDQVYNVSFNDITDIIDEALSKGYSIAWATDVSEKGFSWKNGVAYVPEKDFADMTQEERDAMFEGPKPEKTITVEMRETAFNNYQTTDDHGMQIVGLAKDVNGREYYIIKNSWGTKNDHEGYLYATKTFLRYKTTSFLLNKKALSSKMKKNLKL